MYIEKLEEKIQKEENDYRNWLLQQSPEIILNNAYKYSAREDIVCNLDWLCQMDELSEEAAEVLYNTPELLECLYFKILDLDCQDYNENIMETIFRFAKESESE